MAATCETKSLFSPAKEKAMRKRLWLIRRTDYARRGVEGKVFENLLFWRKAMIHEIPRTDTIALSVCPWDFAGRFLCCGC